jgi:predicted dehydrogenase
MESFMYLYHEQFKRLQEIVHELPFGAIKKIECKFGFPHLDVNNDIRYKFSLAGGALNDAGAYTISSARTLLGDNVKLAWSDITKLADYDVDTSGVAVLINENGQTAVCSWEFGASYINEITLWCEECVIVVDRAFSKPSTFESNITCKKNGQVIKKYATGKDNHFIGILSQFADAITKVEYESSYKNIIAQAEMLEEIRYSKYNFPVKL